LQTFHISAMQGANLSGSAFLQSIVNGLASGGIYILVALGLTLVLSIMGIVQMSHGEIYMFGAYGVYYLFAAIGLNFVLAVACSTLLVGIFGILLERFCFRPFRADPDRAMIIAIGLILVLQNIALVVAGGTPRSYVSPFAGILHYGGISLSVERLVIVVVGFVLLVCLHLFIRMTKTGQAMISISQDREGAALQGIDINRISAIAMFLGCGLAALAGALVGSLFGITPTMGGFALMKGIAVIILGGLGSIPGAVLGGLIIGLIDGIMPVLTTAHIAGATGFGVIILILFLRPQGIWGHE
jgi:branched-chain amino acid transport system permease protein